jgi:hypothetical protein
MPSNIELLQTLNTKICHDLSGGIGSINTCLELMDNSNKDISEKAKKLVIEEANALVSNIKIFKSVYGISENENEMSLVFLTKVLKDFLSAKNIKVQLQAQDGIIALDALLAKAALCLAIVAAEGSAAIELVEFNVLEENSFNSIKIKISGTDIKVKESLLDLSKDNKIKKLNVYNCREHYIRDIITSNDYTITINKLSNAVEYNIEKLL